LIAYFISNIFAKNIKICLPAVSNL